MSTDPINPEGMEFLSTIAVPGVRLPAPRPDMVYNVFQFRDGEYLVLRITEMPNHPAEGELPIPFADVRLKRGRLMDALEIASEVADVFRRLPDLQKATDALERPEPPRAAAVPTGSSDSS